MQPIEKAKILHLHTNRKIWIKAEKLILRNIVVVCIADRERLNGSVSVGLLPTVAMNATHAQRRNRIDGARDSSELLAKLRNAFK